VTGFMAWSIVGSFLATDLAEDKNAVPDALRSAFLTSFARGAGRISPLPSIVSAGGFSMRADVRAVATGVQLASFDS